MTEPTLDRRLATAAEPAVIALAMAGDGKAFAELVRRRQYAVRRFMRQLCRRPELADDLAQTVFLRAWRSIRQLESAAAFASWLKQVMVSVWFDELRRRHSSIDAQTELTEALEPSGVQTPALERDLERALAQLEPRARLCVLLAYSEGHSHAQIAALTRLPLGTAKSLVTRGGARIKELLAEYRRTS
jgi:RNA polymerase sigma factor (sigma-70 family)